ncbi:hypothetical protein BO70DRAFT_80240 [Aspergillus heteromorphus CBS 117.55]|uniref:Uncharacterized protein n=1 Tax=Aspergillus heteromorphus CBS 117.55 TaxID=1448321 RepID=A0A317WZV0_9EURO|nr:uncharacterized protein BO70DRAFT_80240 [Aspergillus heteromorphus CBS 117.55]PWY90852.1 hypothetical protein BO70DRAFT_80240 [Aspergillus heteromorphus CBS 117.55]
MFPCPIQLTLCLQEWKSVNLFFSLSFFSCPFLTHEFVLLFLSCMCPRAIGSFLFLFLYFFYTFLYVFCVFFYGGCVFVFVCFSLSLSLSLSLCVCVCASGNGVSSGMDGWIDRLRVMFN